MAEVVALRWPEEAEDANRLVAAGIAVLYLVGPDDDPPVVRGCLEDWVRVPGDDRDTRARLAGLELRAQLHRIPPFVDDDDRLHHDGRVVLLSHTEAKIATALTTHLGLVVPDVELLTALEPSPTASASMRAEISHLRSRLRGLDLVVRRRRGGYLLEHR